KLTTEPARRFEAPPPPERNHRMRHGLPDYSRHLRAKQDTESATDDGLRTAVRVVRESKSWSQVHPAVVVIRFVRVECRTKIELSPVGGWREVVEADGYVRGRFRNAV